MNTFLGKSTRTLILVAAAALGGAGLGHAQTATQPPAPHLVFMFEETVALADGIPVGPTPLGIRNIVPITGGTFSGPGNGAGIKGTIVPGGWDWQLIHADGCASIKADYMLKTDDGVVINVVNAGTLCRPAEGQKMTPGYTTPVFEAPIGKYEWLNSSAFVGTLEPATLDGKPAVHIRFYRAE
ncbi:DUF3237 domain-containing protein [Asticcacaulis taihuensis]|uniref:DUF3237 domain-containing protein n=1 Tax=Asticcacaulis taihuensis TaxID=260084 RepID=UPI0026F17C23|nr:DUF3237 domain-containing protein [Asticcacaulis taihuensis]